MRILQINTADKGGGAEGSAWNLFQRFRHLGHPSFLAVGQKFSDDPDVFEIPRTCPWPMSPVLWLSNLMRRKNRDWKGMYPLTRALDRIAEPRRLTEWWNGADETTFPGCHKLLDIIPMQPDVIHCHNLHGWYFDLAVLPEWAAHIPIILNLRDTWLLSGHCAYFMDCQRWREGCGNCPHLDVYPRCRKDRTAENLQRKASLLKKSNIYLTAPSQWLADIADQSVLHGLPCKVIPNGIDTAVFCTGDSKAARKRLNLPPEAFIVLFAAAARSSVFKDPVTLWKTVSRISAARPDVHFVCLGIAAPPQTYPVANLHCLPFISKPSDMADYYRSADVFLHTARAEAFGKTVTEAMACGTPPVATAVGGIGEQIVHGKTGCLAEAGNDEQLAAEVIEILEYSESRRGEMAQAAAKRGAEFSLERQADAFLEWYAELAATMNCS